jgi:hypothetical protein
LGAKLKHSAEVLMRSVDRLIYLAVLITKISLRATAPDDLFLTAQSIRNDFDVTWENAFLAVNEQRRQAQSDHTNS